MRISVTVSILLLVLFIGCSKSTSSESTLEEIVVNGQVLERNANSTSDPVPDVTITAGSKSTTSDDMGDYSLRLEPGTYNLKAEKDGFEPYNKSISISEDMDSYYKDIIIDRSDN
ncbi:carboxypeptidase-like regulatory domain-containing protein [Fodinibius saliphilus]|uniref:carboxypeptidase-like regulatory domain-containing protein n=1 Tax=Fodinibius saliphilus TaxID=1920650 RepID=UPI0011086F5F|nr:carboxypeptidase-like regulatory domain-containing protein [Fodinibius saliphilus]